MNNKFQRLRKILLKEKEMQIKRLREDIELREREIVRFEEEIKLIELRQKLKLIDDFEREGFLKKEKIISNDEESREENEEIVNNKVKRKPSLKIKRYHLNNST